MVIDQGSMLDRIDYNVERMATDVKEADKELKVASGYQKRSIKRKVMLLLVILIAGVFILLSLKLGTRGSSEKPAPAAPQNPDTPPEGAMLLAERNKVRRQSTTSRPARDWHRRKRRLYQPSEINPPAS